MERTQQAACCSAVARVDEGVDHFSAAHLAAVVHTHCTIRGFGGVTLEVAAVHSYLCGQRSAHDAGKQQATLLTCQHRQK